MDDAGKRIAQITRVDTAYVYIGVNGSRRRRRPYAVCASTFTRVIGYRNLLETKSIIRQPIYLRGLPRGEDGWTPPFPIIATGVHDRRVYHLKAFFK
jgi:hypothetical protein